MDSRHFSIFTHNYNNFTKKHLTSTADKYGLMKKDALEYHLWVYELYSHIQQLAGSECVLKGGACTQLYLPLDSQRCTADIDAATNLTPDQLEEILRSIRYKFNMNKFYVSYSEYIPEMVKRHGKTIPMVTFMFNIPFIFRAGKKKKAPSLKIDFLFANVSKLDKTIVTKGETLGLKLNYSPICISPYSITCDKLLTFAKSPLGLDAYKIEGFYKNIYDLYYLIDSYNDLESFKAICHNLYRSAALEFELKNIPPINADEILEDILINLFSFAVADLENPYDSLHKRIIKFQDTSLQEHIRKDLDFDTWSIMSMYIYIWATSVKEYLKSNDYSKLSLINRIISQYEEFLSLDETLGREYILKLKLDIIKHHSYFNLKSVSNPLRLIYLHNLLFNF